MKKIEDLAATAEMMASKDYKERFLAEYWQVHIRLTKLTAIVDNWDNLEFEPSCPKHILELQMAAMATYLKILQIRYGIEFNDEGKQGGRN